MQEAAGLRLSPPSYAVCTYSALPLSRSLCPALRTNLVGPRLGILTQSHLLPPFKLHAWSIPGFKYAEMKGSHILDFRGGTSFPRHFQGSILHRANTACVGLHSHLLIMVTGRANQKGEQLAPSDARFGMTFGMLTNVLVCKLMSQANALWLVLDRLAVDNGGLELLYDGPVDRVALPMAGKLGLRRIHCCRR